jgi:hypothetical protein
MGVNNSLMLKVVLAVMIASQFVATAGPGFSMIHRKNIELEVRKPALVRLANTSVAFTGNVTNPEYHAVLESLLTMLATEIVKHEKSLVVKQSPKDAEWTLFMNVTGYSAPNPRKDTQRSGNTTTVTDQWTGSLNVAYRVIDQKGRVHDADNVAVKYDKTSVEGASKGANVFTGVTKRIPGLRNNDVVPHSNEELKQILIQKVLEEIGSKLGNTSVALPVKVATGEDHLNRAETFMSQRLWSRALQELESANAFPNPEDESYRLYDMGLVYEAMSYDAKTYKDQRANLFQSQEMYDKAMEMNRKEKYFVETVARLRDSIARYKTLDEQQKQDVRVSTPAPPPASPAPNRPPSDVKVGARGNGPTSGVTAPNANTAADIIRLYKSDIPKQQIIEIIQSAPLDFNPVDIPTVLALKEARVPIDLQNEMRKKVGAPPIRVTKAAGGSSAPKKEPVK